MVTAPCYQILYHPHKYAGSNYYHNITTDFKIQGILITRKSLRISDFQNPKGFDRGIKTIVPLRGGKLSNPRIKFEQIKKISCKQNYNDSGKTEIFFDFPNHQRTKDFLHR